MRRIAIVAAVGIGVAVAAAGPASGSAPFSTGQLLMTGYDGASSVDAADFNRDGSVDLVVATIEADRVTLYLGGPFPSASNLATGFDRACYVRAADLNGDGWMDVLGSKRGTGYTEVRWWENPGNGGGGWSEEVISDHYFTQARSVEAGDIDGDGDLDVLVAGINSIGSWVSWFENRLNSGGGWIPRDIAAGFAGAHGAVVVDVNGDGRRDVVAVAYDGDEVAWFENDGTIIGVGPWPKHTVATGFDGALCVAAGDLDRDGDPDVVAGAFLDGEVTWFENRVDEGLGWVDRNLTTSYDGAYSVQPVDLDSDGDLDILATGRSVDDVSWFENQGVSSWTRHDLASAFDGARSAVAVDFDVDGDLDVVAAAEFDDEVGWLENLSNHQLVVFDERQIVDDGLRPDHVDVEDLDQDGQVDIAGTSYNTVPGDDVHFWWQDHGSWDRQSFSGELYDAEDLKIADVNSDGLPDLVVVAAMGNEVSWFERIPDGFQKRTVDSDVSAPRNVDTGDLNCDGHMDIVAAADGGGFPGSVTWWQNGNGSGTSWTEHPVTTSASPVDVKVADMNRDGYPDLVLADDVDDWLRVLYNQGCGGVLWLTDHVETGLDGAHGVDVADVNGDGWPDLVAAAELDDSVSVWLQTDTGWDRRDLSSSFDGAAAVGHADLDRDGDLDVFGAARTGGRSAWWENYNGKGTSWSLHQVDQNLDYANSVVAGDVNGDGASDLVVADLGVGADGMVALYENQGGHYMVFTNNVAPLSMGNGIRDAILAILPLHGGRTGDLDMEVRLVLACFDDGYGTPLTSSQANAILEKVQLWDDLNGSGNLEVGIDVMLADWGVLSLNPAGCQAFQVPHGLNPRIGLSDIQRFLLTVTTTADASSQPLNQFRVSHPVSPLCKYYDYPDIWLQPRRWETVYSSLVGCGSIPNLIFADGFEMGDTDPWSDSVP